MQKSISYRGFTLIELSIVLVIIGLIVGGVLTGRSLIDAAAVRAQIAQIDKYNAAVNTFVTKYNALPGDLDQTTATTFGFSPRGTYRGQGDGNGILEGAYGDPLTQGPYWQVEGENAMFWVDLTTANGLNVNLIDGSFSTATSTTLVHGTIPASSIPLYLPAAKLGNGNYIYTYSSGYSGHSGFGQGDGNNYYGLSAVISVGEASCEMCLFTNIASPGVTVGQAYSIDKKIDDGFPTSGNVVAGFLNSDNYLWDNNYVFFNQPPPTSPLLGDSTTCFDNDNGNNPQMQYSVSQAGNSPNCGLSFRFQ